MKMPTKAELLRLQEQYHTDKRIAEALGGNVTEHLVQYWRRKKGIPHKTFPKFSEKQVRELWERFGDDFRCGREIGLSKAGFYSWRRKYGIKDKPKALKLEQLEFMFGSESKLSRNGVIIEYYRTASEKILADKAGLERVDHGQQIMARPDLILISREALDVSGIRVPRAMADRVRIVESRIGAPDAGGQAITLDCPYSALYDAAVKPGGLAATCGVAAGGIAALSSLVYRAEREQLRELLTEGIMSITVPHVIRITLQGRLQKAVSAFDIFFYAYSELPEGTLNGSIVEYSGNVVERLSLFERVSLCDLTQKMGAVCAYTLFDEQTRRFLARRQSGDNSVWFSDRKAYYFRDYVLIISGLEPQVVPAENPRLSTNVANLELDDDIETVIVGGASGGSIDALKEIADILRKCTQDVRSRFFISPLDREAAIGSVRKKLQIPILSCGGIILPPGISPFDLGAFSVDEDSLVVSTPMESLKLGSGRHYLVNHQTAAASAIAGKLTCPR